MSPFERAAEDVSVAIRSLSALEQVALFTAAAEVLREGADPHAYRTAVFDRTASISISLLLGTLSELPMSVLADIESATPEAPSDDPDFTTIQDAFICLDTAIRASVTDFDPSEVAWYLLEPTFQAVCDRLFGSTDVGSAEQEAGEAAALADPAAIAAVAAIAGAVELLSAGPIDRAGFDALRRSLTALRPTSPRV